MEERGRWRKSYTNAKWIFPLMFLFIFVSQGWIVSIGLFIYFIYCMSMQNKYLIYRDCIRKGFQYLSEEEKENFEL